MHIKTRIKFCMNKDRVYRSFWNSKEPKETKKATFSTVSTCIRYADLDDNGWIYNPRLELPAYASPLCGPTCANKYHPNLPEDGTMKVCKCVCLCVCTWIWLSQVSRGAVLFIIWLDYDSQTCAVWPVRQSSAPCIRFPSMIMTHSRFHSIKLCVVQITHTTAALCMPKTYKQSNPFCHFMTRKSFHYICEDFWCVRQLHTHSYTQKGHIFTWQLSNFL